MKKTNKNGFTIVEIVVVITIISIVIIGGTNLNFRFLSDRQSLEIFINTIMSNYEDMRNNALFGKSIGSNGESPEKWRIAFNVKAPNTITTSYKPQNTDWKTYKETLFPKYTQIKTIYCIEKNNIQNSFSGSTSVSIEIQGSEIVFVGLCENTSQKIKIDLEMKESIEKTLEINKVNGIIRVIN